MLNRDGGWSEGWYRLSGKDGGERVDVKRGGGGKLDCRHARKKFTDILLGNNVLYTENVI